MTKDDIWKTLLMVRQAYQDSLDGKSISFTGVNGRAITNHDPKALRDELEYWERRWRAVNSRGGSYKLANFL
ncbi:MULTISPECIES: hypothetical protein [Enterobacteriaceae]|uniref:Phage protein n=1 Tax=Enterobacter asburiae TaxID=61645 RepID=A0ABC9U7M6_ENTAS|nr:MULTISPECIES: hypothetical protein [Enterobacteriaceae]MBS3049193.1 hypothetical protein [Enterobacter mori]MCU3011164.1 hypothetical protein [Enterobacter hormaechei subsp. hoffmannii]SAE40932.1 Uncharacterised protein [Enterobacter cloacae]AKM89458.1 hypothetical protein ABT55_11170 [Enterobacter ludwigii]AZL62211.1 hypothetical protein EI562_04015 [Enterobacter asburiae]